MFKNTTYVNSSGNTLPAIGHTERALKEQSHGAGQRTHSQVKQDTDLQYQHDPSGVGHVVSNPYKSQIQIDHIVTHDQNSISRNAKYDHNHDHDHKHIPVGDEVDETTFPTVKQTLNERYNTVGGVANGQDDLLAMNERRNNFEPISHDQGHGEAAPAIIHASHGNKSALGISSVHQAARSDDPCGHIETSTSIPNHTGASLTKPATLQGQAYIPIEGPIEVLRKHLNVDSHKLACEVPEAQGAIQIEYPNGRNAKVTRDIGWHKANIDIPDLLIGGYTNGELFAFIRCFNKNVFNVKAVPFDTAGGLDLNDAWS
ncbi:hypothetical protein N7540_013136 [Penicillium herquei]|nr:hypothetical protein N7540_013136 [Penicillium herquei]